MIRNYADHASNERTFLAWVRTAVSLVGFGLVAARFTTATPPAWSEFGLLAMGAVMVLIAYVRLHLLRRRINRSEETDDVSTGADALLVLLIVSLFALVAMFAIHVG